MWGELQIASPAFSQSIKERDDVSLDPNDSKKPKKRLKIGEEKEEFKLKVKLEQSHKDRFVNFLWTVAATVVAVTIVHVAVLPLFL